MAFSGDPGPEERYLAETPLQEASRRPEVTIGKTRYRGVGPPVTTVANLLRRTTTVLYIFTP
jgi:hypothetical protein